MAGDWIKMRVDLQDDPAVVAICDSLELDEFQVIGRLHKLWGWADKHTADGVTTGVTPKWVDRYLNQSGFADSLMDVGWLEFDGETLKFPGFDIHNGRSAKSRCDASIRQRVSRSRHAGVTNGGDSRVTIPRPFIRAVLTRDNYTCVYCGTQSDEGRESTRKALLSMDHITPHSRGNGRQAIEDLATCCKQCNGEKNDRTPEEWGLLPTFLQDGVRYESGTLVTEKCDTSVTETLPREDKRREEKKVSKDTYSADFELFWESYPPKRRTSKKTAYAKWLTAIKSAEPTAIIEAAKRYAASPAGMGEYVKGPEPWLNGQCWQDAPEAWGIKSGSVNGLPAGFDDRKRITPVRKLP